MEKDHREIAPGETRDPVLTQRCHQRVGRTYQGRTCLRPNYVQVRVSALPILPKSTIGTAWDRERGKNAKSSCLHERPQLGCDI